MSVMNCPNLEQIRQQLFDEIVKDFSIDDKSFGRKSFDGVVKKEEGSMLRNAFFALDGAQKTGQKLGPVARYIVPIIF